MPSITSLNSTDIIATSDNQINGSEVLTLTKAAKISPMVNETTIGAGSRFSNPSPKVHEDPKIQRKQPVDPWKRNEWVAVDSPNLRNEKNRNVSLMDFRAVKFKMELKNAEKIRQKQVRLEMAKRQEKLNELDQMMNNLKISLSEKSATKLQKNLLLKEEQVIKIAQQIEINARLADEQIKEEMEEYSRKTAERINSLKRAEQIRGYFQSIKSLKDLFIMLFEKFVKTCISNQQNLKNFAQYSEARENFLKEYEGLLKTVNGGQLTKTEVDSFEALCDQIKETQRALDAEIKDAEDELERKISERKEKQKLEEEKQRLQQKQQQEQEQQQQQQEQEQQQQQLLQQQRLQLQQQQEQPRTDIDTTDTTNVGGKEGQYEKIMKFFEDYSESVKPLKNDDASKKFRAECKKGVNTISNLICSKSNTYMQDNYDKLVLILSGNSVKIAGTQVLSSAHPLGIRFVHLLVAEMFVKQADTAIDVNTRAGFSTAALIVAIWQKFPDFGKLFLGYLYKQSPFLAPHYLPQKEGMTVQDYKKAIGFVYNDNNVCEEQSKFLKRLTGLVRLYSSVIISKTRRGVNKPHPHGIEFGWTWITSVLNLEPIADVSATILHEFILIVGAELWVTYKSQFVKLLNLMQGEYLIRLNEVGTGGPKSRLKGLLQKIMKEKKIDPPEDTLPPNFW